MALCAIMARAQYNSPNKTYNITTRVTGNITVGDNSTLVFSGNGRLVNATVTGKNIKVVPGGTGTIFSNCNFKNATFASSKLSATNFGMKSDLKSKSYNYKLKGVRFKTKQRQGTDNTAGFTMLGQFLTGSKDIKIHINGSFYTPASTKYISIKDASGLEIYGPGTIIVGLAFYDCRDCNFHDLKFVGLHTVHDFPPVWSYKQGEVNGVTYTIENAYNCAKDGADACGLAWEAIQILPTKSDTTLNRNFKMSRLHFEMRRNGLAAGARSDKFVVRNVDVDDVTFDHIFWQPIGLHISGGKVNNVRGKYCLQGVDLSTGTNNVTVTNSTFDDCATGPKQETTAALRAMSYNNVIDGCTFGINEKYFIVDASQYVLNVAEGRDGDTFTVRNSTFNVNKNRKLSSVMTRAYRCVLDNVTFNIDVAMDSHNTSKYGVSQLFSVYGETSFEPRLELNNVTVNFSSGTKVYLLATPGLKVPFHFTARNLTVNGSGSLDTYFENMALVDCQNSSLNMTSSNVASHVTSFKAKGVNVARTTNFVVNNLEGATVDVTGSTITAGTMVKCQQMPASLNVSGNTVTITGTQAITGIKTESLNSKKFNLSGNTFTGTTRSISIMDATALKKLPSVSRNNTVRK